MYYGNAAATDRNLIERVGMVHVRRGALAAHVEPVLRGVVLTWHGSRDAAARREHALARYLQGAWAWVAEWLATVCACAPVALAASSRSRNAAWKNKFFFILWILFDGCLMMMLQSYALSAKSHLPYLRVNLPYWRKKTSPCSLQRSL